jgi:hypothetical protein
VHTSHEAPTHARCLVQLETLGLEHGVRLAPLLDMLLADAIGALELDLAQLTLSVSVRGCSGFSSGPLAW